MKIKSDYLHEAREADKRDDARRTSKLREMYQGEKTDAAQKPRQTDSIVNDEQKFASILENPPKPQKTPQPRDDAGQDNSDDGKNDKKESTREASETLTGEAKPEKYESTADGGTFGGQSGFGGESGVSQLHLNENFVARSILHIADLERMVSTIRSQMTFDGRREIVLQLRRSVLEGLRVKITTDAAAGVGIEFFAANENVRSQIEKHSDELAGILRGRGINLQSLTASLGGEKENQDSSAEMAISEDSSDSSADVSLADNTFNPSPAGDGRKYNA